MKYAVIIPDGGADQPIDELGGKTPFEAARTPHLDRLAKAGRIGCATTTPPDFLAGSDVCSMCLFGYDPARYHTGRAPLEAAALGIPLGSDDWIFRVNLVTVGTHGPDEGLMLDHSAGAIPNAEARTIVADLERHWRAELGPLAEGLELTPGVSYRNILVDRAAARHGRDYQGLITCPPHEIPRRPWRELAPKPSGKDPRLQAGAELLGRLMESARRFLPGHPVNLSRVAAGKRPANMVWIWGQGTRPAMPTFEDRFGLRGAMTTAVDLLAGIAALIGWSKLDVPGVSSYHDNDYAGQGLATVRALDEFDIVCCHVESPDEASHQGDWKTKVAAIEAIDEHVVGPIAAKLQSFGDLRYDARTGRNDGGWRLLVIPDHYTLVSTRVHDATPVPFLLAGSNIRSAVERTFSEREALESDLRVNPGSDLMEYFLRSGIGASAWR